MVRESLRYCGTIWWQANCEREESVARAPAALEPEEHVEMGCTQPYTLKAEQRHAFAVEIASRTEDRLLIRPCTLARGGRLA